MISRLEELIFGNRRAVVAIFVALTAFMAQTLGLVGFRLFRIGAEPPMPVAPWQPAHPLVR